MSFLLHKVSGFKLRLTHIDENEPIAKVALCLILLLDFFILSIIFGGLEDHTSQLTSPDEYFPREARAVFIQDEWTVVNQLDKLQYLVLMDYQNYSYRYQSILAEEELKKMHSIPKQFFQRIKEIVDDKEFEVLFLKRQSIQVQHGQINDQFKSQSDAYHATVMETVAGLDKVKKKNLFNVMQSKSDEIDQLNSNLAEVESILNEHPSIKALWALIQPENQNMRETLIQDLNDFEQYYLLKEFLWQLVFLVPLLIIAILWHNRCLQKVNKVRILISAHLLVLVSIPIVFKLIHLALDLIPYHFFEDLFVVFEKLRLIALWHYLVIFFSISVAVWIIYFIQQRVFNKKRLSEKRLTRGECVRCGKKQPGKTMICPFCGSRQRQSCAGCQQETPVGGIFCVHCGTEQVE